jgi:hypothetical protein
MLFHSNAKYLFYLRSTARQRGKKCLCFQLRLCVSQSVSAPVPAGGEALSALPFSVKNDPATTVEVNEIDPRFVYFKLENKNGNLLANQIDQEID